MGTNIILCEKAYYESGWCKQILHGLKNEFKKRRIEYRTIFEIEEIRQGYACFVIGSDYIWISDAVAKINRLGITPIVIFNQLNHIVSGKYHSVSSDIAGSITALAGWLKKRNKDSICLYGVNPQSVSDMSRNQSYTGVIREGETFYNNGSLERCFESFAASGKKYDAVICTNDFAAISLVKNLMSRDAEMLKKTEIISCSRSSISAYFDKYIKSVNINMTSLGTNAYQVWQAAQKGENISEISLTVKWDMEFEHEEINYTEEDSSGSVNVFYEDEELNRLMNLDRLVEGLDKTDKIIINLLMEGYTYADISEKCHMSEQCVKYRVKQYSEKCKVKGRREIAELLEEYHIKNM